MKIAEWNKERALLLLDEGYNDIEIADIVGATEGAVKAWRAKNRLKLCCEKRNPEQKPVNTEQKPVKESHADVQKGPEQGETAEAMTLSELLPILAQAQQICQDVKIVGDVGEIERITIEVRYGPRGTTQGAIVRLSEKKP